MRKRNSLLAGAVIAAASFVSMPGAVNEAEAFSFIPFPFFTPISDCGTVGLVPDLLNEGEFCKVWFPDNTPGAYIVGGIDGFDVGDRVFVDGLICNTCLTTCAAGAILNATVSSCN